MASGQGHGSMSISMKLMRLLIVLLNLVFVIIGVALLAIGIYVVKDPKMQQLRPLLNPDITAKYAQSLSNLEIFAIVVIAIGGILLVIGFLGMNKQKKLTLINYFISLGCCGAIKGFRFLHILYAIIIGGIILVEIAIIIVFVVYQNRFKQEFVNKLQKSIVRYYVGTPNDNSTVTNPISLSWDFMQFNLQCCGAVNQSDYSNTTKWNRTNPYPPNQNLLIPFTCCPIDAAKNWNSLPTNMSKAAACATTGANAYPQGCYNRLVDLISSYKTYIIIGGVIVGVVEIFAFLFAILLVRRKEDYETL
jgi:hypothetical protein